MFHLKRSADEEKREHGDKVSKLLHWVSNVQQIANNNENARRDSNANTDASQTPQVKKVWSLSLLFLTLFSLGSENRCVFIDLNCVYMIPVTF